MLEWGTGTFHSRSQLLGYCSCGQSVDHLTCHNSSDSPILLAQCGHPTKLHNFHHTVRDQTSGEGFSHQVCRSRGLSNNGRRWSHVIPEGPPGRPDIPTQECLVQVENGNSPGKVKHWFSGNIVPPPQLCQCGISWCQLCTFQSLTTRRELSQLHKFQSPQCAPLGISVTHTPSTTPRCCGSFFSTHDASLNQIVPLAAGELGKPVDQLVPADLASSRGTVQEHVWQC